MDKFFVPLDKLFAPLDKFFVPWTNSLLPWTNSLFPWTIFLFRNKEFVQAEQRNCPYKTITKTKKIFVRLSYVEKARKIEKKTIVK